MSRPAAAPVFPLDKADLCVKCGLCLPHCPTYGETEHEGDSPRGRIALMQGLATGTLAASVSLQAHLDGCLGCRACEQVCPAKVPYGELIDAGRAMLVHQDPSRTRLTRWVRGVLTRAPLRRLARFKLWLYPRIGLQGLIRSLHLLGRGRLARLESFLPARLERREPTPQAGAARSSVQLFAGCVSDVADQATLNAARRLCARIGLDVEEPETQTCCGAIDQHAGRPDAARALVTRNLDAFPGTAPIAYCASGCGASLREYDRLSVDPRAASFARRATDLHALLAHHWPLTLKLQPLPALALVHLPCTQRNVVGGSDTILGLLNKIPKLQVEVLDPGRGCCGAAGTYFLSQPAMADRLLDAQLDRIVARAPDYLLSSNIGCALHLAAGLRRRGLTVPVLHPVQLLERQSAAAA